jgi:PAS domain S-box-containing protein
MTSAPWRLRVHVGLTLAIAAAYVLAAKGALLLFPATKELAMLWPSAGIALAALLVWGRRALAGVFVGCLIAHLTASEPDVGAVAAAGLSTLYAALAWLLLTSVAPIDLGLRRVSDVLALAVLGAGTTALVKGGVRLATLAATDSWVAGAAMPTVVSALATGVGILIVAPVCLTWYATRREPVPRGRRIELALVAAATIGVCVLVFNDRFSPMVAVAQLPYALFPVMFWAGLRFGPREVAAAVFGAAMIAVWYTSLGEGPFAGADRLEGLASLYLFLTVLGVTSLMFAAALRQRAEADAAVRASGERYRLLIERMNEGLVMQDRDGVITYVSDRFCEIIGRARAALVGRSGRDLAVPEQRALWEEHYRRRQQGASDSFELSLQKGDGEPMRAYVSPRPLFDERGRYTGSFALITDVTDRHRAEEQARQHLQSLAHVARVSAMGEMASAIAHEINQPLTAIANYAYACVRLLRGGQATGAEALEVMQRVAAEAERAGEIVRKMRSFVRGEEGQVAAVDANFLVTEVLQLAAPEARQSGVELVPALASGLPEALADSIQIQQVLLNLVRNAVEAIVAADCATRRVRVETARGDAGFVEIRVADTGPGLAPEALEKVFEPFYTTKPDGIGIGLALSRSIVDAHGGRLWAAAGPGAGVTFHLTLPIATAPEEADA